MQKVQYVNLGRTKYTIADDAYHELTEYIKKIAAAIHDEEVMNDIEYRMAELLAEKGIQGEIVVVKDDVAYLKSCLGSPNDFSDSEAETATISKKLFRDKQRGYVGGVTAGLAAFLNINVTFIRIAFVATSFMWGFGIIAYCILWLIVPNATTPSDRLRMQGKAVNLATIADQSTADTETDSTDKLKNVIKKVYSIAITTICVFIFTASLLFIALSLAVSVYFLGSENITPVQYRIFPASLADYIFGGAVLATTAVICTAFGMAIIDRKWVMKKYVSITLVCLLIFGFAVAIGSGSRAYSLARTRYNNAFITTTQPLQPFNSIDITGSDARPQVVRFEYANSPSYAISAKYVKYANVSGITHNVDGGVLKIDTTKAKVNLPNCDILCIVRDEPYIITIQAPEVTQIDVKKNAQLHINSFQHMGDLKLNILDSSAVYSQVSSKNIAITAEQNSRTVVLTNPVAPSALAQTSFTPNGNMYIATDSDAEINTSKTCDINDPFIHFIFPPIKLTLNGATVNPIDLAHPSGEIPKNTKTSLNCISSDKTYRQ